jgi:hypothetical protein
VSTWGDAWGSSWGPTWGAIDTAAPPDTYIDGPDAADSRYISDDDLFRFATAIILSGALDA